MKAAKILLASVIAVLPLQTAVASELSGGEVKELIAGKTVRLDTPLGIKLPLRYRTDGAVAGDISGFSMASMFAPKEEGRWWVDGQRLCQQWPTWYKGRTFCFTIKKLDGNRISWQRDDGATGTAVISGAAQ
ncbi:hypothetical protein [Ciceribacter sp. L1K22]|uniref:hypothetical protein n=1 Tax=Ciceribacter sp. L1K22 TaxID=2820275 RepID=UPI001ABE2B9B|nr:hypothetical protein [Ciceribacter sp. L1K22]MBO3761788.1 hypothetical protein [Ciceribacter sp. L1K22]